MMSADPVSRPLPEGVLLRPLEMHRDERGAVAEIFRAEWETGIEPLQWNSVTSAAGVLRGVHVHLRHDDYLIVLSGRATVGLRDLRQGSPTEGLSSTLELRGDDLAALTTPPGVAHGFYFHEPSTHVYSVSHYWDLSDELGCHWADPALQIAWPVERARVSERDAQAPPLQVLLDQLKEHQPIGAPR